MSIQFVFAKPRSLNAGVTSGKLSFDIASWSFRIGAAIWQSGAGVWGLGRDHRESRELQL